MLIACALTGCIQPNLEEVDNKSDKVVKDSIYFESIKIETH